MVAELRRTPEWEVVHADCLAFLRTLPDGCVDAIVTDPPYGMSEQPDMVEVLTHWLRGDRYEHGGGGFMGKSWDSFVPGPEYWRECLRVLKPGGHLLAFAATRTYDLMAVAVRLGGFEVRDMLSWLYGTGFPKSLDVSKAIDAAAGAAREVTAVRRPPANGRLAQGEGGYAFGEDFAVTEPATDDAKRWDGWGTALKPGQEPVVFAVKPVDEWSRIGSCLSALRVNIAAEISASSLSAFVEAFASALRSAGPLPAMSAGLSAETATSLSGSTVDMSLSIVSSWLDTWAALSTDVSTSTTVTVTRQTIDSKILSFCLSRIMDASTRLVPERELSWLVSTASSQFLAARLVYDTTLARSAIADATGRERIAFLGGVDNEPIVLARKPLVGTVAANVLAHGTGALNIDACRIENNGEHKKPFQPTNNGRATFNRQTAFHPTNAEGRWPANVILGCACEVNSCGVSDEKIFLTETGTNYRSSSSMVASGTPRSNALTESTGSEASTSATSWSGVHGPDCAAALLDEQAGERKSGSMRAGTYASRKGAVYSADAGRPLAADIAGSTGGASRFFYVAKASRRERDFGLEHLPPRNGGEATDREDGSAGLSSPRAGAGRNGGARNIHCTVKPINLMRYLCRLVCAPGGLVLDPFAGSGTTGMAAVLEGLNFLGVELGEEYLPLARGRIAAAVDRREELLKMLDKRAAE